MSNAKKINFIAWGREFLTASVWGISLAVGSWETHTTTGILGALCGGFLGSFFGFYLKGTRLRSYALVLAMLLLYPIWSEICSWQIDSQILASILGVNNAYFYYDGLQNFGSCFLVVTVMHALAWRYPAFTAIELITIAIALATPLAGHRDGFICRPHGFVDAIWSRGWDPIPWFKAFGVMVAGIFLVATTGRYNKRSTIIDLSMLLLLTIILGTFSLPNVLTQPLPEQLKMDNNQGEGQEKPPPPKKQDENKDKREDKPKDNPSNSDPDDKEENKNDSNTNNDDKNDSDDQSSSPNQDKPVAVVVFYQDCKNKDGVLYFRQGAQSYFNGKRIIEDTSTDYDKDIASHFPQPNEQESVLTPVKIPTESQAYFKPITTKVCLITNHTLPFGLMTPINMVSLNNPNPNQFIRAYRVQSQFFTGDLSQVLDYDVGDPNWDKTTWAHYLAMPKDERYADLASEITNETISDSDVADIDFNSMPDNPMEKILACKLWLEDNCTYDSRIKISDSEDVVAKFLFGERTGYCVHLAHSLTYLARSMNIPARVGTGYASNLRNCYGGSSLMIRAQDSHAWCEVYLKDLGWFPIEVTPKKYNQAENPPPDADLQKMLGQLAREESNSADSKTTKPKNLQVSLQKFFTATGKGLGILCLIGVIICYAIKLWRHINPYFSPMPNRIDTSYKMILDRLSDVGIRRKYGEAREDFATRYSEELPALAELTGLHMRKALGEKELPPKVDGKALNKIVGEVKKQLRCYVPLWKRFLGAFNPFSWLLTK